MFIHSFTSHEILLFKKQFQESLDLILIWNILWEWNIILFLFLITLKSLVFLKIFFTSFLHKKRPSLYMVNAPIYSGSTSKVYISLSTFVGQLIFYNYLLYFNQFKYRIMLSPLLLFIFFFQNVPRYQYLKLSKKYSWMWPSPTY